MTTIALIGTVGVPGTYGGFETLAEQLVRYHQETGAPERLIVYCEAKAYPERPPRFLSADLVYIPLPANGVLSTVYDLVSMLSAVWKGADVILVLGVSGSAFLPVIRLFTRARIITNIDGIEWKREKWKGLARWFLRTSERVAVHRSDVVLADNAGISDHVRDTYGQACDVIAYGGDHALSVDPVTPDIPDLPADYAFALCRIEPENNVALVLEAFADQDGADPLPLVFVGNWSKTEYGQGLKARFAGHPLIHIIDPIYDLGQLRVLRAGAALYVHGHSAGGTNPSLVEIMHFAVPVLAFDCVFNRATTEDAALYFADAPGLRALLATRAPDQLATVADAMGRIAGQRYTWAAIGKAYFDALRG